MGSRGARHGGNQYPWGSQPKPGAAYTASFKRSSPVPVGSFANGATPSGIVDMIGNVWEWTYSPMRAYPGGTALPDSLGNYRVIRGGAFNTPDEIATAWLRGYSRRSTTPVHSPAQCVTC